MGFRCRFHGQSIPCVICAEQELIRCEAENKQRKRDGEPEHDTTELKKLLMRKL